MARSGSSQALVPIAVVVASPLSGKKSGNPIAIFRSIGLSHLNQLQVP
jgi:hypothetical protein